MNRNVCSINFTTTVGQEPWSSGYGRRLTFQRSWVWIPAPDTGWTWHFFTLICCKNYIVCLKRPKTNEKEAEVGPFLKNFTTTTVTVLACNVLASRISVLAFDPTAYMTESSSTVRQTFSLVWGSFLDISCLNLEHRLRNLCHSMELITFACLLMNI